MGEEQYKLFRAVGVVKGNHCFYADVDFIQSAFELQYF